MKTAAILFCAIVLCVHAISDDEVRRQWQEFQEHYQKSYRSPVEVQKRFNIFKKHLEEIEEFNKLYDEGKVTWKKGINQFSDMTEEELKEYFSHGLLFKAFSSEDETIQRKWTEFQQTYKKSYRSPVESKKRFEIFRNNVIKMEEHNDLYEQGLVSDKQGINQFSDWTEEEFRNYVNKGLIPQDVTLTSEEEEIESKWNDFQKTYKKSYRSPVESKKRFEIFRNNVIKMEEHNDLYELGLVSDKQGINQFSDWTEEEFRNYVNKGLIKKDSLLETSDDKDMIRRWNEFKQKYNRSYDSSEDARRFEIFKENVRKIDENNERFEQGKSTFLMEINQFSDWTHQEMVDYLIGH